MDVGESFKNSEPATHRQLDYAAPRNNGRLTLAVAAALVLPVPLFFSWALEFAEEFPGGGYMLSDRGPVAILIVCLASVWIIAVGYLLLRWRRSVRTLLLLMTAMSLATLGCDPQSTKTESAPTSTFSATQPIGTGPVAAIWYEGGFLPMGTEASHEKLIVGYWADGTVIWSTDRNLGGPPYRRAQITPETLGTVVDRLNATDYFTLTRQVNFGPDASYTVIAASARGAHQWIGSWHEQSNPNIVITEHGVQSKSDPKIEPPSPAYQHFLKVWADSRAVLEGAIPADGVATESVDVSVYKLGR